MTGGWFVIECNGCWVQWLLGAMAAGCNGCWVQWLLGAMAAGCNGCWGQWLLGAMAAVLARRCIKGLAPPYLQELCCPTVAIQRRILLCSSGQAQVLVPHTRNVIRQSFLCGWSDGLEWSPGGDTLRLTPVSHSALFLCGLQTTLFDRGWAGSTPE